MDGRKPAQRGQKLQMVQCYDDMDKKKNAIEKLSKFMQ